MFKGQPTKGYHKRLLKNSHLAAVLVAYLCGVALLRLRVHSCGCDDLTIFEQPGLSDGCENSHLAVVLASPGLAAGATI